ncbi:MAG: hypothetical protein IJR07_07320 [Bacteroidaceae bacterium]|nr:hypothetical protein [Bacteroidaceae bacterium]
MSFYCNAFYHSTEALLSPVAVSPMRERRYFHRGTADTAMTLGRYCDQWTETFRRLVASFTDTHSEFCDDRLQALR